MQVDQTLASGVPGLFCTQGGAHQAGGLKHTVSSLVRHDAFHDHAARRRDQGACDQKRR